MERARRLFAEQLESRRLLAADYWVTPMSQVHSNFTGDPGTIARFGDLISADQAFFEPLELPHQNAPTEAATALSWIQSYLTPAVWDWQSPENGAAPGTTIEFPLEVDQTPPLRNIDNWLANLNPEMAVMMWGTNAILDSLTLQDFTDDLREVVSTVKTNGTIPILTTIPPLHNFEVQAGDFAQAMRDLAIEQEVPLIDFHQEILMRNPGSTWDGALIWEGGNFGFYTETFTVTVSDGQMTFDWLDLGGSGDVVLINSIEIDKDNDPSFTPVRLDFGTASSPIEAGYARVEVGDVYNAGVGYGWLSGTLQSRDRAVGSDLQRDFVFASNSMSFAADVPNGTYDVTVIMGDANFTHEEMQLSIEGVVEAVVDPGGPEQVETLISGDGVHPSNPATYIRDFSETALNKSGYTLRNYMTLLSTFDVYSQVIDVTDDETPPTFTPIRLDFGTASSPVQSGYSRVDRSDAYNSGVGYGWLSGTRQDRDRPVGNDVERDFVFALGSMSFGVDVPDGTYDVTVIMGDASYAHEQMQLSIEGDVQAVVSQSGPTDFHTNTFTVAASGGQMTFDWLNLGGPAAVVLINSIEIGSVATETLTLVIDSASISENGGTSAATLTRSGSSSGDLVVALSSDDTGEATVPATVTILDGQASVPLTVTAVDDVVFDGTQTVTITATASGFPNGVDSLDVTDDETPPTFTPIRLDFGTASSPVQSGYSRVDRSDAYNSGVGYGWLSGTRQDRDRPVGNDVERDFVFALGSMSFGVDVPDGTYDVTVIMGDASYAHEQMQLSIEGDVQAVVSQSGPTDFHTNTFTVAASGGQMTFDWLNLGGPAAVVLINSIEIGSVATETLTLVIDSASISENGGTSAATLTRSGSSSGDLVVALSSDDTGEATVPATVTILDGQASVPLTVTAVDDVVFDGTQTVTITATASGFPNGVDSLDVTDDETPPTFTPIRLDFGTASSPVQSGYSRVDRSDAYNSGVGYGWLSGTRQDRDRPVGNDVERDFVFALGSMSFGVDVPDGTYDVTVIMGDASYTHEQMQLSIEGDVQAVVSQSGPTDFHTNTFTVAASGGQMTFDWLNLGGPAAVVLINSIEIVQSVSLPGLTHTLDGALIQTRRRSTLGDLVLLPNVRAAGGGQPVSSIVDDSMSDPDGDSSEGGMSIIRNPARPLIVDQEPNFVAGHSADAKPESSGPVGQDLADLVFADSEENGLWW